MVQLRKLSICIVVALIVVPILLGFFAMSKFRMVTRESALNDAFVRISTGGSNVVTSGASIRSSCFFQTEPKIGVLIGMAWCAEIDELQDGEAPFTCVIMGDDLLNCEFVSRCGIDSDDSLYVLTTLGNSVKSLKIKHSLRVFGKQVVEQLTINDKVMNVEQGRVFRIRLDEFSSEDDVEQRDRDSFSWKDISNRWISREDEIAAKITRWLEEETKTSSIDQFKKTFTD